MKKYKWPQVHRRNGRFFVKKHAYYENKSKNSIEKLEKFPKIYLQDVIDHHRFFR